MHFLSNLSYCFVYQSFQYSSDPRIKKKKSEQTKKQPIVVSFGGAFSNHLIALASTCHALDIPCIGIVRGKELEDRSLRSQTLLNCERQYKMMLKFVTRSEYRTIRDIQMSKNPSETEKYILQNHKIENTQFDYQNSEFFFIPEGGSNINAVTGVKDLTDILMRQFDLSQIDSVVTPVGSATTLAGLATYLPQSVNALGIACVEDFENQENWVETSTAKLQSGNQSNKKNWQIIRKYTCGGFYKSNIELEQFIGEWQRRYADIPIEKTYSAKMIYGVLSLIFERSDLILNPVKEQHTVIMIHTGIRPNP